MKIRYIARIPGIPGQDLLFPTRDLADHEIKNARKAGHDGYVEEVLLRA